MTHSTRLLPLLALVAGTAACAAAGKSMTVPAEPAHAAPRPGAAIDRVLAPRTTPAFQSEVLVLGTTHLSSERERLTDAHLAPLLARLERFGPTRIAIEALHPDELALLAEREQHDSAAAQILDMFGRTTVTAGHQCSACSDSTG